MYGGQAVQAVTRGSGGEVHVVAGVLRNPRGEVLLARRGQHAHLGGLWEFPGGKLRDGERPQEGLRRELEEELGIRVERARPLMRIPHAYPDRHILLDVWEVADYGGEPRGREGQELRWSELEALAAARMPPADRPIVNWLRLPDTYLITPELGADRAVFLGALEKALARGLKLVQLRAKRLGTRDYRSLARDVRRLCAEAGARLLLNAEPALAEDLGADGVHLSSAALMALEHRCLGEDRWVGASCHNRTELAHARLLGLDFVVVGPVKPTTTHPGARPIGWPAFQALITDCGLPVFAIGGMKPSDLGAARDRGARGIAAIRSLWGGEA